MVAPIIVTVLAYLHIISAMGWLGGAVLFVSALAPGLRSLSPAASMEFLAKVGPRAATFFAAAATATIIFGLGLLAALPGLLGTNIDFGIALGLIAYLDAIVAILSNRKADHLAKEMLTSGHSGPPPPEFMKALKRGGIAVTTTALLLVITLMFMVASGFPY